MAIPVGAACIGGSASRAETGMFAWKRTYSSMSSVPGNLPNSDWHHVSKRSDSEALQASIDPCGAVPQSQGDQSTSDGFSHLQEEHMT